MHFLNSEPFLMFLQKLTGIEETLMPDPYFVGGGFHEIKPGGYLKIHADFNRHNMTNLDRRINALVYLNEDWDESYGGHFELWDKDMTKCHKKVLPVFNTLAIFSTTDFSYHGHPDPLACPEGRSRKSLALYYYSNGRPQHEISDKDHSTVFKARDESEKLAGESSFKSVLKEFVPPILVKAVKSLKN
jgi:Rps23 Pro-64 3,4-dihydroxylase Tpa1-like proline 4-hydroxylase